MERSGSTRASPRGRVPGSLGHQPHAEVGERGVTGIEDPVAVSIEVRQTADGSGRGDTQHATLASVLARRAPHGQGGHARQTTDPIVSHAQWLIRRPTLRVRPVVRRISGWPKFGFTSRGTVTTPVVALVAKIRAGSTR